MVMVGDGALGLWAALRDVFLPPEPSATGHKVANVLGCLPTRVQASARTALAEIRDAPGPRPRPSSIDAFARDYGTKGPEERAQGGRQDHRRRRGAAHLLRLPG
jgi:hypothetical protein